MHVQSTNTTPNRYLMWLLENCSVHILQYCAPIHRHTCQLGFTKMVWRIARPRAMATFRLETFHLLTWRMIYHTLVFYNFFFIFRLLNKQIAFLNSEGRRRGDTSQRHNSWRRVLPQLCMVIDVEATWHHVGAVDFDANPYRKNGLWINISKIAPANLQKLNPGSSPSSAGIFFLLFVLNSFAVK